MYLIALHFEGCQADPNSVCYSQIGCFSNDAPFNNSGGNLPLDPNFIQTTFYLATVNRLFPTKLVTGDLRRLARSRYNASLPTKIIVHGFLQTGRVRWIRLMAKNFIRKGPMNVIAVDWGRGSGFPYRQAVANTRVVGAEIARLVQFLIRHAGASAENFHIIGHSLGAHIAGYAGERLPGLHRITGLDPAGPSFKGTDPRVRLDPSDATFVDAIHTDASEYETISGYGMSDASGHIDFYPNGGVNQPGCPRESWTNIMTESYTDGIFGTANDISCSHSRSIRLFTESIRSQCQFLAFPCSNKAAFDNGRCFSCGDLPCPAMGYNSEQYEARGKFYLKTNSHPPFCGHMYVVTVEFGVDMEPQHGDLIIRLLGSSGLSDPQPLHSGSRQFRPNQVRNVTVMSTPDIGNPVQVQVDFREPYSFMSSLWGSQGSVSIRKITVFSVKTGSRMYFCGHGGPTRNGQSDTFHHSTSDPNTCLTHQIRQQ